jgi:gamma-glutamylaminecyclotransferase
MGMTAERRTHEAGGDVLLFVFGTLKRGFPLHERGLARSRFIGEARTTERFPMVIAGDRFAPMLLHEPGIGHRVAGELYAGHRVAGELYAVSPVEIETIDGLEHIGKAGHFRLAIEVDCGGSRLTAFAYFKSRMLAQPLHSGHLDRYDDDRFIA